MTEPSARKTWLQRNLMPLCIVGVAVVIIVAVAAIPRKKEEVPPPQVAAVNVVILPVAALPEMADSFDLPGVVEAAVPAVTPTPAAPAPAPTGATCPTAHAW